MPPRPSLEILRKGLSLLKESVETRKDGLMSRLRRKEKISASDEAWLDDAANHVDEDAVMDKLEKASDYERGFARLDAKELGLVEKLRQRAGDVGKKAEDMASKKRKKVLASSVNPFRYASERAREREREREKGHSRLKLGGFPWSYQVLGPPHGNPRTRRLVILPTVAVVHSQTRQDVSTWRSGSSLDPFSGLPGSRVRALPAPAASDSARTPPSRTSLLYCVHVSGEIIRQKWIRFADLVGIPEDERLALSEGWLGALTKVCGLKELKRHGEADSADLVDIEADRKRIQELILTEGYALKDIFNMDETGLFWA
ncbi:hypothetical protein DFH09DRAFT_1067823 [Mycena vulgaris]|nr:hypothetical protein DFH09DRAFT_1067823 [Mycena vulgaris]